eukprot:COSAG01_NODE_52567_length_345_cov_19.044715_2_plen_70_part_01
MHTHHLLYGVLTQYLSPGPCLDVVDWWSSSRPVVADAIARVPFARCVSVFRSGSVLTVSDCIWLYLTVVS